MLRLFICMISLCVTQLALAESCKHNGENLIAFYNVVTHTAKGDQQKTLELWRADNIVAHHYPQTQITETWERVNHKLIKPTRFFDAYARAIEYQPGEKVHGKTETNWSFRNQLFSDELIASMTPVSNKGSDCDKLITYQRKTDDATLTLVWQPSLKLAHAFRVETANKTVEWQLTDTRFEQAEIEQFFAQRFAYQSTDFADIGDDHTDPFLTNMVHQGFIEKGASGYYNSQGEAIEGGHHH